MFSSLNFHAIFTAAGMAKLGQIIVGDLTMAGDNVVIMGSLASGLPDRERKRVLLLGVGMALVFLITFAVLATQLLKVTGLVFAGGLLLLWVAYNLFRELHPPTDSVTYDDPETAVVEGPRATKTFFAAAVQIMVADLSMSLDNVLAVAATARDHPTVLFIGLALSVTLMGLMANLVARLVHRFRWIAWCGLLLILYVAGRMIYDGIVDEHFGILHLFL